MLYSCDEVLLRGAGVSGDKHGVVTANVANHFGPVAAVKRQRNPLRGTYCRSDNQQMGTGGLHRTQQLGDSCHLVVIITTRRWQFVALRRLDGAKVPQVTTDTGLRGAVARFRQSGNERVLRFRRPFEQQLPYRFAP